MKASRQSTLDDGFGHARGVALQPDGRAGIIGWAKTRLAADLRRLMQVKKIGREFRE
jgi:hypothetical protein